MPLAPKPDAKAPAAEATLADAMEAKHRCARIVDAFFLVPPEVLMKSTRGAAREAFPRQVLMAGLVGELGIPAGVVAEAVGRHKSTVEHAVRVIEALRGDLGVDDLIEGRGNDQAVLSEADVVDFFGDEDELEAFLEHADQLLTDIFAAFRLAAVRGSAYCREVARMEQERRAAMAAALEE